VLFNPVAATKRAALAEHHVKVVQRTLEANEEAWSRHDRRASAGFYNERAASAPSCDPVSRRDRFA
jgi:hypothetical protein